MAIGSAHRECHVPIRSPSPSTLRASTSPALRAGEVISPDAQPAHQPPAVRPEPLQARHLQRQLRWRPDHEPGARALARQLGRHRRDDEIADEAGLEFILPVAKWRGYQGKANIYGRSFETLTHGAALGALTQRIAIFSTVHVPLVTPAFAAKAIATIDHISHGRAGLNIVCGWNQAEFDLHGVTIDPDTRYDHGLEWFQIWSRLLQGGPEFDWDGRFFKLKNLHTDPVSMQRPWPVVMSAGFSPRGRDFAARAADVLFLNVTELDQVPALLANVADQLARHGRSIAVFTMGHVVCRPTRREAEDYFHYFAEQMEDPEGQAYYSQPRARPCRDGAAGSPARW